MTKYHVEFDVESNNEWHRGVITQWVTAKDGLLIEIPDTATVTELAEPVKVGDVLATVGALDRAPGGTIARSGNYSYRKFHGVVVPDKEKRWWRDGRSSLIDLSALQQELPLIVLYVPEQPE
jgi:hypothetical protein